MVPPIAIIALGINPTTALVASQVILSFGIGFALIPLIMFTSSKRIMGNLVNTKWITVISWIMAILIVALNLFILVQTFQ